MPQKLKLLIIIFFLTISCSRNKDYKNINKINEDLIKAVRNNNEKSVKKLLKAGADPNYNYSDKSLKYKIKVTRCFFIDVPVYFCNNFNDFMESRESFDMLRNFKRSYKVNDKDIREIAFNRPLLIAINNNNFEIFRILLKHNAKPDYYSIIGTPLFLISELNNNKMLKYLLKNNKKYYLTADGLKDIINSLAISAHCHNSENTRTLLLFLKENNIKKLYISRKFYSILLKYIDNTNDTALYNLLLEISD